MALDSVSTARLQAVYPTLAYLIGQMAEILQQEGISFRVVQGLRSWAEQDALYAQGRTAPGNKVTNCQGGHSYHNFGLAVDLVPSVGGSTYVPDWNADHPSWKRMIAVGQSLGLEAGATWRTFPDNPHFQLQGRFPVGEPSDEVRQIFRDGGIQAVWDEVTKSTSVHS